MESDEDEDDDEDEVDEDTAGRGGFRGRRGQYCHDNSG